MKIISQNEGTINSSNQKSFSIDPVDSNSENKSPRYIKPYLSRTQKDLLKFYRDLHLQGFQLSDYPLEFLAIRFQKTIPYISSSLAELEEHGYMGSRHRGQNNKERWITYEGICLLDGEHLNQILNQKEDIPYIYLPDQEKDKIKILKEEQNCGQLSLEQQLDSYLDRENTPFTLKNRIKRAIRSTPIGPQRRESVIYRVLKIARTVKIHNKLAYFLKALQKELDDLNDFIRYIRQSKTKPNIHTYDSTSLDELGCFT